MMRVHGMLRAGLLALGVLGGFSFAVSPALAGTGHGPLTGQFGTQGSGDGQLLYPQGVAVDDDPGSLSRGDVYVADWQNNRVEKFTAAGAYISQFNGSDAPGGPFSRPNDVAVDPKSGDVWVAAGGVVDKFDSEGKYAAVQLTGTPAGATITGAAPFGTAWGVAVDPSSGDVYVTDNGRDVVDEFTSAGVYKSQFKTESGGFGVAVDSEGNVYVAGSEGVLHGVQEFSSAGVFKANLVGSCEAFDVAVDPSNGDVYPESRCSGGPVQVFQFQAVPLEWALTYSFGAGGGTLGLAVSLNGTIYVVYPGEGDVKIYAAGPTAKEPTTEAATGLQGTTVTLNGKLEGEEEGYYFAYNNNGSCKGTGKTPEGKATGTPKEAAQLTELEPNVQYTFCIAATNPYGPEFGPPLKVTTEWVPPVVKEVGSSHIGPFEATLEAKVNPEKQDTTCVFEYAKSGEAYGLPVACEPKEDLGKAFEFQPVSLHLEHLEGGTTYDFRVLVKNATGPSEGTGHFTTAAALVPAIEAESVSVETGKEAEPRAVTFAAQVNPELQETTSCVFEYGKLGKAYEASAACEPSETFGRNINTGQGVSAKVNGLVAGVDYHYCVLVKDQTGASECKDQRFGPPTAVTGAVLSEVPGVAPGTTAPVGGEVNPEELDTRYYVQYGETEAYGQIAPFLPPGVSLPLGLDAGSGSVSVVLGSSGICGLPCQAPPGIPLESLAAGASYHYRLVAYNADGTTYGAPMTLKVLPAPQVGPASVSEVTQESATISTSVNPEGLHTLYELEAGTSTAYGKPYPGDAGSGSAAVPLTFHLSGLEPGTTYHFRLVASNVDGSSSEGDQTFETAPTPAEVPSVFKVPPSLGLLSFTPIAFPTATTKCDLLVVCPLALTRAQKLKNVLKACKKNRSKKKRVTCEKQVHRQYGPLKKKKKK
jgi:NHL repeat